MQTASTKLTDALLRGTEVKALPRLIAEWNQNRYAGIETVDAIPSEVNEDQEKDSFPVSSIVEANRPTRGVIKGRTSKVSLSYDWRNNTVRRLGGNEGFAAPRYSDRPEDVRYYTTGARSIYKYWSSPQPSAKTGSGGVFAFPQTYSTFVVYKNLANVNKIVIGLENTWASPRNFTVQVTTNGTTWTTVATDPTINSKGQVVLYRQGNGSWSGTANRDNVTQIKGVRINAGGMNKADSYWNVIEVSARLERDLSEYVINYDTNFSMSEPNYITPLGTASSNDGNISLSNVDGIFNFNNPKSIYYNLIEKNVKMTLDLIYHFEDGTTETIREFTMYSDGWTGPGEAEINCSVKDFSKYLQEQHCPEQLLEKVTVGEAVWRLCDAIGFVDYNYERRDDDPAANLDYFYTSEEDFVWDIFQSLAEGTQTAVYFDEFGVLQIQTRDAAYDKYNQPVWTFSTDDVPAGEFNDSRVADIQQQTTVYEYEANSVNINYQTTKISDASNGIPKMEIVWEPESSLTLRSSRLVQNLSAAEDGFLQIAPKEGILWPYEGIVAVGGELIKYNGKHYNYFKKEGGQATVLLHSQEEKDNVDKNLSDPLRSYKNDFTGFLKIEERGMYWTKARSHVTSIPQFVSEHFWYNNNNSNYSWGINGGVTHHPHEGIISVKTNSDFQGNRILRCMTGDPGYANAYANYGTRMRIPKANGPTGGGGLFFFGGDSGAGYYVELVKTELFDVPGGPQRPMHGDEVSFFTRRSDGTFQDIKSVPLQITGDQWYDIDVEFRQGAPSPHGDYVHLINIYINGSRVMEIALASGRVSRSGKFGVWVRGNNRIDYEYLYAHDKMYDTNTDMSTYDRIRGGYASTAYERFMWGDNMYNFMLTGNKNEAQYDANTRFYFEEFGPVVHEVREMDVTFNKGPVQYSSLYNSNETQILVPHYYGTPYRAKFMMANASRDNAVANGEDQLMFGSDSAVEQKLFIYGRLVYQEDQETHTVKDDDSIRRRGKIEVDFDNKWVQSKAEAEKLGEWILKHFSFGSDEVEIVAFGNPLLQLGDLVFIHNPEQNMSEETHRYFVVGISNSFDNGLSSTFKLRRAKI